MLDSFGREEQSLGTDDAIITVICEDKQSSFQYTVYYTLDHGKMTLNGSISLAEIFGKGEPIFDVL